MDLVLFSSDRQCVKLKKNSFAFSVPDAGCGIHFGFESLGTTCVYWSSIDLYLWGCSWKPLALSFLLFFIFLLYLWGPWVKSNTLSADCPCPLKAMCVLWCTNLRRNIYIITTQWRYDTQLHIFCFYIFFFQLKFESAYINFEIALRKCSSYVQEVSTHFDFYYIDCRGET